MKKKIAALILIVPIIFTSCVSGRNKKGQDQTVLSGPAITTETEQTRDVGEKNSLPVDQTAKTQETSPVADVNITTLAGKEQPKEEIKNHYITFSEIDKSKLNTSEKSWYFIPKNDGSPSGEPPEILELIKKYHAHYLGDTSKKVLYLTFDEGYENGYTPMILDVLKKHEVKAAFFVVKPYITGSKDIVKRMADEGHQVCNHSVNHPSMAGIIDQEKFNSELLGVEKAYEELTGKKMHRYFRPPMGKYSELSLYYTAAYGYKSVFWSFAYNDWETNKQPSHDYARNLILQRTHNGAIILLHAVSKTNAEILDSLITEWKNRGYEFRTLDDLP